jgi:hypothetical protein
MRETRARACACARLGVTSPASADAVGVERPNREESMRQGKVSTVRALPEEAERRVVGVIYKGERQRVEVALARFKGRAYGDVRLLVPNKNKPGEWIPTRKGCTIGLDQIGQLMEALERLRYAAAQDRPSS